MHTYDINDILSNFKCKFYGTCHQARTFFLILGKLLMKDLYYFHYFYYIILQQLKGLKEYSFINHQGVRKTIYVPLLQKELKLVCD